ncbi:MAG: NADH:ubiquinone reductase (Na(+)-transporting) subunit C [Aureispira sp.]
MEKKEESTVGVYLYVLAITTITALILSLLYTSLNPMFEENKAEAKKEAILSCIPDESIDLDDPSSVAVAYEKVNLYAVTSQGEKFTKDDLDKINGMAENGAKKYKNLAEIDLANEAKRSEDNRLYPVYEYKGEAKTYYVVAIRGNGLWDKIWGYIALEEDLNTIAGIYFDHKNETPGLGAEIKDSKGFKDQFIGKKIFEGEQVALTVLKRPKEGEHYVTGISGATITCDGVTAMFEKGMSQYEIHFEELHNKQ